MMTLVIGGSKCGKSSFAEELFSDFLGEKIYIATMLPFGEEAHASIAEHRKKRMGKGFATIEKYTDIEELSLPENCGVLLECMGNLCANEMFRDGKISVPTEKIMRGIEHLRTRANRIVIVSNDVSSDGNSYGESTTEYIKILSELNRKIAEISDNVIECVFGIPLVRKGALK